MTGTPGSQRSWSGAMPQAYEQGLVPAFFRPFAVDLAERVARVAPARVLELAAGTGVLTRELLARLPAAELVATDLNPGMVALGAQCAPGARWQQADALDLPAQLRGFDVVVCQFGVMFFPDKARGLRAAREALHPGAVLLASTWGTVAEHAWGAALTDALAEVLPESPPQFVSRVPHGYADPQVVAADAAAAGLVDVAVERVVLTGPPVSAAVVMRGFCTGTPLRPELEARGDLEELTARVVAAAERRLGPAPTSGPMTAYVLSGRAA